MSGGWIDRHGDVWTEGDDGLMHTPETAPFSREHVERKWGPLTPVPSEVAETTAGEREVSADDRYKVEAVLRKAARDHLGIAEGYVWDSGISSDQADALLASPWLAAHVSAAETKARAEAWDEAVQALAWAIDQGNATDALPYVAANNPYRLARGDAR